ncbi:MAG: hypothetical protein KC589_02830 [Nanoarchaeota archaeon]|nr:hypothetical protein [Nanoarchaeota archaeon]
MSLEIINKKLTEHKPLFVISDLSKFAFNDIHHLLLRYKHLPLLYEANYTEDGNDDIEYVNKIRQIPKIPSGILKLNGVFKEEFIKDQHIRDYLYAYLISFDFLRIDDKVYQIKEPITSVDKFVSVLTQQSYYSAEETNNCEFNQINSNFVIFCNPIHEVNDIVIFDKFLKKGY